MFIVDIYLTKLRSPFISSTKEIWVMDGMMAVFKLSFEGPTSLDGLTNACFESLSIFMFVLIELCVSFNSKLVFICVSFF